MEVAMPNGTYGAHFHDCRVDTQRQVSTCRLRHPPKFMEVATPNGTYGAHSMIVGWIRSGRLKPAETNAG